VELALCLKRNGYAPEQVQDYYPTPGTASTVMYYTGINPLTMKQVYVATDYHEKQLQRALLQFNRPQNAALVREALKKAGREDLIGHGADCLVRPESTGTYKKYPADPKRTEKNGKNKTTGYKKNEKQSAKGNRRTEPLHKKTTKPMAKNNSRKKK
jgi:hypothetical protein